MKNIKIPILKYITPILIFTILLFAGVVTYVGYATYDREQESIEDYTHSKMKSLILDLEIKLSSIDATMIHASHSVNTETLEDTANIYRTLESFINDNSYISNACLDVWDGDSLDMVDGDEYTFYVGKDKKGLLERKCVYLPDEMLSRQELECFYDAYESGQLRWSQPYYDNLLVNEYVVTSYLCCDNKNILLSTDVNLMTLLENIDSLQFYENSQMYIRVADGRIFTLENNKIKQLDDDTTVGDDYITIKAHYNHLNIDIINVVPKETIYDFMWTRVFITLAAFIVLLTLMAILIHRLFNRMTEEALMLKKMEAEVSVAARIQNKMLTEPGRGVHFAIENGHVVDVMSHIIPAREVGGDLYEYRLQGDNLVVCIGDVSGKGIPASVVMTKCCTLFHAYVSASDDPNPSDMLKYMNEQLCRNNEELMFVTMWMGVLNLRTGLLKFASAGHNLPVIVSEKTDFLDKCQGIPLGLFEDAEFPHVERRLNDGDSVLLYTDGITEAEGRGHALYGDNMLLKTCQEVVSKCPQVICDSVLKSVKKHAANCVQSDDITLLCVTYNGHFAQLHGIDDVKALHELTEECDGDYRITLALEELVVNAFEYGKANFASVEYKDGRFAIVDDGAEFDPTKCETPQDDGELRVGGLGLPLVRKICSEWRYERAEGYNLNVISVG